MKLVSENWVHEDGYFVGRFKFNSGHLAPMYHVKSHLSLIQLVGYAKFINQKEGHIYFRGQTDLYRTMLPSVFRNIPDRSVQIRNDAVCAYVKKAAAAVNQLGTDTPDYAQEPLLQHYGIKTRWLDIVDNIWTALNFATLKYSSRKLTKIYTHVSRHPFFDTPPDVSFATKPEIDDADLKVNESSYYYLILLLSDETRENPYKPGTIRDRPQFPEFTAHPPDNTLSSSPPRMLSGQEIRQRDRTPQKRACDQCNTSFLKGCVAA